MALDYHHPSSPVPLYDVHPAKRCRLLQNQRTTAYSDNLSTGFAAKLVHTSANRYRVCSINRILWTPSGRRVITGYKNGEFTLWYGQSFKFETTFRAHLKPIKSMVWSHNDDYWISGDDSGSIKYWQSCMINVTAIDSAHKGSVRDLSFCKTNLKFCSGSDDTLVKIWDFQNCQEEQRLIGHGGNVRSVDWHPTKSLVASGGKDRLVKLWDANSGRGLCSFHDHKRSVQSVKWNQNGNWLLTASNDQVIKLYDLRTLKELASFCGHQKEVTSLAWHPFHEQYFVSGSIDGSILHWLVGHQTPQVEVHNAHNNKVNSSVWDLQWHPNGHMLCSGSNDGTTKFWCRNSPGDGDQNSDRGSGLVAPSGTQNEGTNNIAKWLNILNLDVPQIQPPSNLGFQNTRKRKRANDQYVLSNYMPPIS